MQNGLLLTINSSAYNSCLFFKELNETRTRVKITLDETDASMSKEYETRLADALRQMRAENDYQIRVTREETQEIFEKKVCIVIVCVRHHSMCNLRL